MTIHKSKGMEFHTVIALGIENEVFSAELTPTVAPSSFKFLVPSKDCS